MKKRKPGRLSVNESFKGYTTKEVLEAYESMVSFADDEANLGNTRNEKKNRRDAKVIENYLVKTHLKNATLKSIQEFYENANEESERLLLEAFAKKAKRQKDLIWAYNMNHNEEEAIDKIVRSKLEKMKTDWLEIAEDATKGSRICYLCIKQMIAKAETLGDIIFALESNDENIINPEIKKANKEALLEKLPTIEITEDDRKELNDEFIEEGGKVTLTNWQ